MRSFWELFNFEEALDRWLALEPPSTDLSIVVTDWVIGRADDKYNGVSRRVEVAVSYWFGVVPGTVDAGHAVVCGYWIDEEHRGVRCDTIATLALPL